MKQGKETENVCVRKGAPGSLFSSERSWLRAGKEHSRHRGLWRVQSSHSRRVLALRVTKVVTDKSFNMMSSYWRVSNRFDIILLYLKIFLCKASLWLLCGE